ncbi:hypothetical protein SASC256_23520 [Staphylococcus argenteus]|nr:hypothetical protein SASC252_23640 [Staphylococcus argenteus]GJG02260.1 hypothetical protein SASC254_24220 [Staphylococcus argenteus]GJG04857.1 hypothetical protein SASC256_23520 [Staphylococcus argenteus]GJG07485.1 hypothetical protein SASC257_23170 [Staphylococcus argenteus]GJG10361.1 hypothetical protein SASC260_25290 [Staphylococcus argenteus]
MENHLNSTVKIIKHILTHKSLVNYGYQLIILRILYATVYPFIITFRIVKFLFVKEGRKGN